MTTVRRALARAFDVTGTAATVVASVTGTHDAMLRRIAALEAERYAKTRVGARRAGATAMREKAINECVGSRTAGQIAAAIGALNSDDV